MKKQILDMVYNKKASVVMFTEYDGTKHDVKRKVIDGSFQWNNKTWTVESWKECLLDSCCTFLEV